MGWKVTSAVDSSESSILAQVEDQLAGAGMVIGRSRAMAEVAGQVLQVAAYPDTTVLLQGESGTGKDVVAHAIHVLSRRAAYSFVDINCAALPDTLLETELFGVEAGAFTDAKVSRDGYLLRAHGGTLFLDEIGSMPRTNSPATGRHRSPGLPQQHRAPLGAGGAGAVRRESGTRRRTAGHHARPVKVPSETHMTISCHTSGQSSIIAWAVSPGRITVPPSGTTTKALAPSSEVRMFEPWLPVVRAT